MKMFGHWPLIRFHESNILPPDVAVLSTPTQAVFLINLGQPMPNRKKQPRHTIAQEMKVFSETLKGYGVTMDELMQFSRTKNNTQAPKPRTILDIAGELVNGERNKTYKHPNENFRNIKNFWNAYFLAIRGRPGTAQMDNLDDAAGCTNINEFDVGQMMILMKVARLATNQTHADSLIDIAGYARCCERVLTNK